MRAWGDPGKYLVMWSCGDEENCNCWEPRIEVRGQHPTIANLKCFLLEEIELGNFTSQPEMNDWIKMKATFDAAIEVHKPDFIQNFEWPYSHIV